jgi:hypothetical protein
MSLSRVELLRIIVAGVHPFRHYTVLPRSPLFGRLNKNSMLPGLVSLLVHRRSPELTVLFVVFSVSLADDFVGESNGWKAESAGSRSSGHAR